MKLIPLSGKYGIGKFAMVDDEDYEKLIKQKWYGDRHHNGETYATTREIQTEMYKKGKLIRMHRMIMDAKKGQIIDHKNRNTLDNQKHNLRFCTLSENQKNKKSHKNSSSEFLGVHRATIKDEVRKDGTRKERIYWMAKIKTSEGKSIHLGAFKYNRDGEIAAAKAYNEAAKIYHGEFANLNKI